LDRLDLLRELAGTLVEQSRPDHPLRVGIDGRCAAGKTTLADKLATLLQSSGRPFPRL